jgi:hypothetical protein
MESTVTIEIELPVTFTASKGYPATHEDPGCPDEINDLDYSENELIRLVNTALEDKEIEGTLLDEASQAGIEYEYEKAEYLRDQMQDR